ncbi:MAG: L,D-transpeptidase family protein [Caulobacteraceae bacterium]
MKTSLKALGAVCVLALATPAALWAQDEPAAVPDLAPAPALAAPLPAPLPPLAPLSAADGQAIALAIAAGEDAGIPGPDLAAPLQALASGDEDARRTASDTVAAAAIALAAAEHGMRIDPHAADGDWPSPPPYDPGADFAAARLAHAVPAWADALAPTDPAYLALVAARKRYAQVVANGGWVRMGPFKPQKVRPKVTLLDVHLADEGYSDIADFQSAHGLAPNGVLTQATLDALNVPAAVRLATIDANLERWRWFEHPFPADRVVADIPAAEVDLYSEGAPVMPMRAIVGDARHHTPILGSRISSIVFNPPWVVPASIAKAESYPRERANPGYFRRNGFAVVNGQLIQKAGPKAALGYVKFDFPNRYAVYLHDTPGRSLFTRDARGLSHGCVRVQKPRELAAALLAPQNLTLEDVNAAIATGDTKRVQLTVKAPVFILYRTAVARADGTLDFRPDVYGWDATLGRALSARGGDANFTGPLASR